MKKDIILKLPTPCFVFDAEQFCRNYHGFSEALGLNGIIGYSVKTNRNEAVLKTALRLGAMAEVVSAEEYRLARQIGFNINRIIYNGPLKDIETFREAMNGGAVVNIESWREIDWLRDVNPRGVGLRISINVSKLSPKDAVKADDTSRFGFDDASGEVTEAIRSITAIPGMSVSGLHLHRSTDSRRVDFYRSLARYAVEICEKHALNPKYIDFGGGYHAPGPGRPTGSHYINAIAGILGESVLSQCRIIIEPGNGLVSNTFTYVTEVIDAKHGHVTVDGSRNDIDPIYRRMNYKREIVRFNPPGEIAIRQTVGGCTCMERDVLMELTDLPALQTGDRIVFREVGAYTVALAPSFIRKPARIIVKT